MQHKILVVEDETDVIDMLQVNLRSAGFQVSAVVDGASALAKARNESPSLIILDLMLPGMSGLEIARCSRAMSPPGTSRHHAHGQGARKWTRSSAWNWARTITSPSPSARAN